MNKPAYTVTEQIALLRQRGMLFHDEKQAYTRLKSIGYYRLKGYWWDTQRDTISHLFQSDVYFEDIIERYDFDRKLRLILFGGIEQIEIALRTKLICICMIVGQGCKVGCKVMSEDACTQGDTSPSYQGKRIKNILRV
ncbi:MAG: Abi family protein [Bacteroidales bacterium]|jgi:abortive infection bacteriophage resistance protein|nr:Abi family protein [Bacteroidales bacterium]